MSGVLFVGVPELRVTLLFLSRALPPGRGQGSHCKVAHPKLLIKLCEVIVLKHHSALLPVVQLQLVCARAAREFLPQPLAAGAVTTPRLLEAERFRWNQSGEFLGVKARAAAEQAHLALEGGVLAVCFGGRLLRDA